MRKNAAQHGEVKNIVGRLLADKADIFAVILGQQQTHRALQQGVMMPRRKARESFDLVEDVFVFVSDFAVVLVQRRAQTGQQEIHQMPFAAAGDFRMRIQHQLQPCGARFERAANEEQRLGKRRLGTLAQRRQFLRRRNIVDIFESLFNPSLFFVAAIEPASRHSVWHPSNTKER